MTADRFIWCVGWFLVLCIFFTETTPVFIFEIILLVGLAMFFKWIKYKEEKEGIKYDDSL